jgi:hypothetical protein
MQTKTIPARAAADVEATFAQSNQLDAAVRKALAGQSEGSGSLTDQSGVGGSLADHDVKNGSSASEHHFWGADVLRAQSVLVKKQCAADHDNLAAAGVRPRGTNARCSVAE